MRRNAKRDHIPAGTGAVVDTVRVVYILNRPWRVEFKQGPILAPDGDLCDGLCDTAQQVIYVAGAQTREWQRFTLTHEIQHAIDATHSRGQFADEEARVRASESWVTVIADPRNSWYIAFLKGE